MTFLLDPGLCISFETFVIILVHFFGPLLHQISCANLNSILFINYFVTEMLPAFCSSKKEKKENPKLCTLTLC